MSAPPFADASDALWCLSEARIDEERDCCFIPFCVDFCSILELNLEPRSFQNPSKIDPKSDQENFLNF